MGFPVTCFFSKAFGALLCILTSGMGLGFFFTLVIHEYMVIDMVTIEENGLAGGEPRLFITMCVLLLCDVVMRQPWLCFRVPFQTATSCTHFPHLVTH
jgi:hypothetical protein